jgi:hypothetical protein
MKNHTLQEEISHKAKADPYVIYKTLIGQQHLINIINH